MDRDLGGVSQGIAAHSGSVDKAKSVRVGSLEASLFLNLRGFFCIIIYYFYLFLPISLFMYLFVFNFNYLLSCNYFFD